MIIDISWPLQEGMTTYKNRDDFGIAHTKTWQEDGYRESRITCGVHAGTHVDAPSHFLESGTNSDELQLHTLMGPCTVLDVTHVNDAISKEDLITLPLSNSRVLFKTKNSLRSATDTFNDQFIYINESAARYLKEQGVICVGIDYLGIERNQPGHPTHKTLLGAGITVVEGLRLTHVSAGQYTLICLPLALVGLDAAPARAVLVSGQL
jgi:arylformamidase